MKVLPIFAVAALVALSAAPAGFAKDCGTRPAKPAIPDGKTASEDAMRSGGDKIKAYVIAANGYLTCLASETASAKEEAKSVSDDYAAQVKIYNSNPPPAK
jgi:hypothetical protein